MSTIPTTPPSGFRDFLPDSGALRGRVIETISRVYRSYGFSPIDTPVEAEKAMSAMRRERPGSELLNPFDDGLPDPGYLIQQLSQRQRDIWLARINTHPQRSRE